MFKIIKKASSPDELALVNFAKFSGVQFEGLDDNNNTIVNVYGQNQKFKLLHILEFNSTRKRMSVIVENENNEILLFTKGADSIIMDLMEKSKYFIY